MSAGKTSLVQGSSSVDVEYERLAQLALASSGFRAVREIKVVQVDESLVMSGVVSTFFQKQVAQELVRAISGGLRVVNEVEVP